jgi:GH15 family glucan-1,4-alpha-glucosidase
MDTDWNLAVMVRKYLSGGSIDASAMWLAFPYGVVGYDDARFQRTLDEIKLRLLQGGGVARYPEDTYYGGGHWPLLSCWLAIVESRLGQRSICCRGPTRRQTRTDTFQKCHSNTYQRRKNSSAGKIVGAPTAHGLFFAHTMFSVAYFCLSEA